jgi:hypothetical protein
MNTPWGSTQGQDTLAPGIVSVYTAGHGGIVLSPERQKQLLAKGVEPNSNFLKSNQYWEEDCDWAIPFYHFADDIKAYNNMPVEQFDFTLKAAKESIEYWSKHPLN